MITRRNQFKIKATSIDIVKIYPRLKFISILLLMSTVNGVTQSNHAQVLLSRCDDWLCVSVDMKNLFSPKTAATIKSGLPAIVDFEFIIKDSHEKPILKKLKSRRVIYDVWRGIYYIYGDSTYMCTSLDSTELFCGRFNQLALLPLSNLKAKQEFSIHVRAQTTPISRLQNQKLKDWLANPNQTVEEIPGKEHTSGFRFSFSKLISMFIGSEDYKENVTPWYTSAMLSKENLE